METLTVTTVFWLLVIGASTGWILGYLIGHEGVTLISNVIWGAVGAPVIGIFGLFLELGGVLMFSLMGTLALLFLANVFHLHHVEDVSGDLHRGMRIKRKK